MEDSKTNISRHICIITDVKAVVIRKRTFHNKFLRIRVGIRKRRAWAIFVRTLRGAAGNVVTYHSAGMGGFVFASFSYDYIVAGVKYFYQHDSLLSSYLYRIQEVKG